jgi:hypothetical protein
MPFWTAPSLKYPADALVLSINISEVTEIAARLSTLVSFIVACSFDSFHAAHVPLPIRLDLPQLHFCPPIPDNGWAKPVPKTNS